MRGVIAGTRCAAAIANACRVDPVRAVVTVASAEAGLPQHTARAASICGIVVARWSVEGAWWCAGVASWTCVVGVVAVRWAIPSRV